MFVTGLFALNSRALQNLKSTRETAAANQVLLERFESVRRLQWSQLTSSSGIQTLLGTAARAEGTLPRLQQEMIVAAYPASSTTMPLQVTRASTGVTTVNSTNSALTNSSAVSVLLRLTWKGANSGATRTRENTMVVAKGGVGQ